MRITCPIELAAHLSTTTAGGATVSTYITDQVRKRAGCHPDDLRREAYEAIAAELAAATQAMPRQELDPLRYILVTVEDRVLQHLTPADTAASQAISAPAA